MTQAWVILTGVDGRTIYSPSEQQLASALDRVFAAQASDHDGDPPAASLRFGYDDGLMYVIEVNSEGELRFEEWSDRDCEIALAPARHMHADRARAELLWTALAQRQVARIREQAWT